MASRTPTTKVVPFIHKGVTYQLVKGGEMTSGWDIYRGSSTIPENFIAWAAGSLTDAKNTVRDMARGN